MAYERVNWENLPSKNTPVNADNLNKMDEGIAELQNNINKISNVQVLQLNLVPNEEYIYNSDFITFGIRMGNLVYIVVEFGWKKVFDFNDTTTAFISGFPTNLVLSRYVYPTDATSGHRYRMRIHDGKLLNWFGNPGDINYGDSANKTQRLEILGYLQD